MDNITGPCGTWSSVLATVLRNLPAIANFKIEVYFDVLCVHCIIVCERTDIVIHPCNKQHWIFVSLYHSNHSLSTCLLIVGIHNYHLSLKVRLVIEQRKVVRSYLPS